jgi:Activator of Hsp90 ATPase homolog 1-like protein
VRSLGALNVDQSGAVDFVSEDPAYADPMIMTWEITDVDGGTRVDVTADYVPEVVSPEDHAAGLNSSLVNLAGYLLGQAAAPR